METNASLPTHTLYFPEGLSGPHGSRLPLVIWANGGCANAGSAFRSFLSEIASYGYLVIATGPRDAEVPSFLQRSADPDSAPPGRSGASGSPLGPPTIEVRTHPSQMIDAINWAIAQNQLRGGFFEGKLDVSHIAVMGQSCGGLQALEASVDPRISTTVLWNSGVLDKPSAFSGGKVLGKQDLAKVHHSIAYFGGGPEDMSFNNASDDFARLRGVPVFRAWERGASHMGSFMQPNGGEFAGIGITWLNWQLRGDRKAKRMFVGPDCGLCTNAKWTVQSKNLR